MFSVMNPGLQSDCHPRAEACVARTNDRLRPFLDFKLGEKPRDVIAHGLLTQGNLLGPKYWLGHHGVDST